MRQQLLQHDILAAIVAQALATPDLPATRIVQGHCMIAVESRQVGLAACASYLAPGDAPLSLESRAPGSADSTHALAARLAEDGAAGTNIASRALAAVNSLLPPPDPSQAAPGENLILERGKSRNVAIIGHFPFVERMRDSFANLWVIEKKPRPGDRDASESETLLPQADVVAITGTTLLNGTLAGILNLCDENAFLILLGPSTPFAPCLFDFGLDVLAGSVVLSPDEALQGIAAGSCFHGLKGTRPLAWARPGASGAAA